MINYELPMTNDELVIRNPQLVIRIVMPVLNQMMMTAMAVHSLRLQGVELDLVIVDNGSTDRTPAAFAGEPGIRVIENPERFAYARSVNMGAALPGEWDVLVVTNNDTVWGPGALHRLARAVGDDHELTLPLSPILCSGAGVAAPRLQRPDTMKVALANVDAVHTWWSRARKHFTGIGIIDHPYVKQGGYAFAISRRLWETLHGMDERYDLFAEDYDLFARAARHTKLVYVHDAYVDHLEHQTVAWIGEERDKRMIRNRFRLEEHQTGRKELVSVIIPVYNRYDVLAQAMDSVLAQTMPHWRLYVIDDGSPDWDRLQTLLATRYSGTDGLIGAFRRPRNEGPGAARNYGLEVATGKYVAFLDSDDIWHRDHLEAHYYLHERTLGLIMSYSETDFAWRWFDERAQRYRYRPDRHPESQLADWGWSKERVERECFIKTSATFFNRRIFRDGLRFRVDPNHRSPDGIAEDWELFKEVARLGPVAHIPRSTARTHWAKNVQEESHHSARLIPWADFTGIPSGWVSRETRGAGTGVIGAVIPTIGRPKELEQALTALGDVPIMVVCDGREAADAVSEVMDGFPQSGLIELEKPVGPSAARNRGAEHLQTDWLWFLDDDDVPLAGALEQVLPLLEGADAVIAGLLTAGAAGIHRLEGAYTSGLFVRADAFARAGGFPEHVQYAEERTLLETLERMGMNVKSVPVNVAIKTAGSVKGGVIAMDGRRMPLAVLGDPR